MLKRFAAMLLTTVMLAGSIVLYYRQNGIRSGGVFHEASGIRPDAVVMRVNGDAISAEEYLYWLDSVCEYLVSYLGSIPDFDAAVTETMTLGQFAKEDAAHTAILYAVVRQLAQQHGFSLTAEDEESLAQQTEQYVSYYGSYEAYLQQLQLLGLSLESLRSMDEVPYLYNRLFLDYSDPNGKLYPGEEALRAYGEENGYVTAQLLYFPTSALTETERGHMMSIAADYAAQLQTADDKSITYQTLAAQLGLTFSAAGLTFSPADADAAVYDATAALAVGQISSVIEGSSGYYVIWRTATNYNALTEHLFNIYLQDCQDSAKVEYNNSTFDRIDAGAFYMALSEARAALASEFSGTEQSG